MTLSMLGSLIALFPLIEIICSNFESIGATFCSCVSMWRDYVDVNKCKQEPGSKIAQNISL